MNPAMEKQRILIVDDDRDLCSMLSRYLAFKEYEVEVAHDGADALDKVRNNRYDLIILDIMMPKIDGYEVCQRLKIQREYNAIPILMLSAKSTDEDRITGLKTGADAYISKPFEVAELLKAIEDTFDKNRRIHEELGIRHEISFEFESRFNYIEKVNELIGQLFLRTSLAPDEIWEIKLALHELGINAIEHGNKMDPDKTVSILCHIYDDRLEFEINDEGEGFELSNVPDPTDEEGIGRDRGRGLFLVSKLVDNIEYTNRGSTVRLTRFLNGEGRVNGRSSKTRN